MKNSIVIAFLLFTHFSFSQTGLGVTTCSQKGKFLKNELNRAGAANTYNINYHKIFWDIDPLVNAIAGNVITHFKPLSALTQIEFDLSNALTVDSVIYHSNIISFTHAAGNLLTVDFGTSLTSGIVDSVQVYYHGNPASGGFGSFINDTTPSGNPVMWTLSEPYGAKDWWPCKQNLNDKIDSIDVFIQHPSSVNGISNGLLVSKTNFGPKTISHWKHRYPIATYLICLASADYSEFHHQSIYGTDTVDIANYIYPEDSASLYWPTSSVVNHMLLYDTLFGVYPFKNEKYGHVQFNWGGGMEHQTCTFLGNFSYEVVSHELAHHWFGDMVTCGTWADITLNEGFATYCTGLCYEHLAPGYWNIYKSLLIDDIVSAPDGSVYCTDTLNESRLFDSRLTYRKGAMMINSLRWVVGDSAFYAGVNNYLYSSGIHYGYSRMDQFKFYMESAYGSDLTWFFDDWYYGEGYPSYQFNWYYNVTNQVTVTVNQTQSHPSVSFYQMPLPIHFIDATHDTLVVLDHNTNGQSFIVQLNFAPDTMLFNTENWIICANNTMVGVDESYQNNLNYNVYPTLTTGNVIVEQENSNTLKIEVFSIDGNLIFTKVVNDYKTNLNFDNFNNGTYLIKLNGIAAKRIVKI